jgi:hypothetical protein
MSAFCFAIGALAMSTAADGHGVPIVVNVSENTLIVSNGAPDPTGFASMTFASQNDLTPGNSPVLGQFVGGDLPGVDIYGMLPNTGLYLEVVPRPVASEEATERRWLWYWSELSGGIVDVPLDKSLHIVRLETLAEVSVLQSGVNPASGRLQVANPHADEIGAHGDYFFYFLSDVPPAATGAYGFFARFTSDTYSPSDPFLVVLNYGLTDTQAALAATAINRIAFLAGDYNHDDIVDMADFEVWKASYGDVVARFASADGNGNGLIEAADYTVWRNHAGATLAASVARSHNQSVPEPNFVQFVTAAAVASAACRRRRGRDTHHSGERFAGEKALQN